MKFLPIILQKFNEVAKYALLSLLFIGSYEAYSQTSKHTIPASKSDGMVVAKIENKSLKSEFNSKVSADTTGENRRITRVWTDRDQGYIKIDMSGYDGEFRISAYNMLGKEVKEIFRGFSTGSREDTYSFPISDLPDGLYLCILQGRNLKVAEKFIVSR